MNAQSLILRKEYLSKNFYHVQQLFDRRTEACIRVKSALCIRKYMGRKVHNFCLSNVPTLFFLRLILSLAKVAISALAIGVALGGHLVLLAFALANGWTALVGLPQACLPAFVF